MYANEKSDKAVVPKMRPNKESVLSAEVVEERVLPKRSTSQTTAAQTQSWSPALTGLAGVRQVAQRRKEVQFTALRIRLAHPHPRQRFNVRTQGRSPVR